MAKKILWRIWSTILSAFTIATATPHAYSKDIDFQPTETKITQSLELKKSQKPLLFLKKKFAVIGDYFAGHRSHRSHSSHRSHASHASHSSGYQSPSAITPGKSETQSPSLTTPEKSETQSPSTIIPEKTDSLTPKETNIDKGTQSTKLHDYENVVLKKGDTGKNVKMLQSLLNMHGFDCNISGNFDSETLAKVLSFQVQKNLKADGIVSKETWKALSDF